MRQSGGSLSGFEQDSTFRHPPSPGSSVSTNSSVFDEAVQEVEMLLEAYFMQLDHIFNRLHIYVLRDKYLAVQVTDA